jgi:hypothetical protein
MKKNSMNEQLSHLQAYNTMSLFLEDYYTKAFSDDSNDIGCMLSEMQFLEDGGTADPAAWYSWDLCINKISKENKLTIEQAFNAMILFLNKYYEETSSDDIKAILDDISDKAANPIAWHRWLDYVDKVLKKKEYKKVMILTKGT